VSGFLLDTNVALVGLSRPEQIRPGVRRAVDRGPVYASVLSYWEVLLKSMKGKLEVGEPRAWWAETLEKLGATPLPLRSEHIAAIQGLPPIHQDPFDRALIAQAIVEELTLVTLDGKSPKYASHHFRVLRS
jgi:PIN domain nuclease of toxin-antitoxin system